MRVLCAGKYVYVCVCTCMYVYVCVLMCVYVSVCVCMCMKIHSPRAVCMYICMCMYVCVCMYVCMGMQIHTPRSAAAHKQIHTYIHTYVHTYIHTYIPVAPVADTYTTRAFGNSLCSLYTHSADFVDFSSHIWKVLDFLSCM
jgi:hypothetical protein